MKRNHLIITIGLLLLATLAACRTDPLPTVPTLAAVATLPAAETEAALPATDTPPTAAPPTAASPTADALPPTAEPTAAPTTEPTPEPPTADLPPGVFYDLGEAIITQARFPEDSRFRAMPVRLNGVLAVPDAVEAPAPVVVILHGTHPGCPIDENGVDRWPCGEQEQANYAGFEYLVRELAARGYVALSININAQNTFGFGEPVGGERVEQIVDRHLSALAVAAAGGENGFGVDLAGVADMGRLALLGHSRGGEVANWLADDFEDGPHLAAPTTFPGRGYGPVNGLLLIAPAMAVFGSEGSPVPLAVIVSGCDGDIIDGHGQLFYERTRTGPAPNPPAASVFLRGANHNGFNSILGADIIIPTDRPECAALLPAEQQQQFLVEYAADFLTTLYSPDPTARLDATARLGMDATAPAPAEVMGQPALVASLAAGDQRRPIFTPTSADEMTTHLAGGAVTAINVSTHFCEQGFSVPAANPGSEPCLRPNVTIPGYPDMVVVSWQAGVGQLRFALPEGERDLSRYTAISLRAAVDPLSPLNAPGEPQRFAVQLIDGSGRAMTITRLSEPALAFPAGPVSDSGAFGPIFEGLVPLSAIRLPLADFEAVDLGDITEIALIFDQTESGSLFMADLELVRPPHVIGAYSTLLENGDGRHDDLSGIARFHGASTTCSGVLIDTGDNPDAPATLLTNGHCAQQWDANGVFIDQPPGDGWQAVFNFFIDTPEAQVAVPAARVAYSTMKGRDVAVVELAATVGELAARGITPLPLASAAPDDVFTLRVVGAPVSSVPSAIAFLREERCRAGGTADLFEFMWHFTNAFRNACQDIYGGSSGSPVFAGEELAVIGLMNTTNIGGITPFALGTPCEVGPDGTVLRHDTSYATPVYDLAGCFGADGTFDLGAAGCPLDDGRQLLISGFPTQGTRNPIPGATGETLATWNATLSGELSHYRHFVAPAGQADCADETRYGPVVALAERPLIDDPLPTDEGSYVLCVLAGDGVTVDEGWQRPAFATVARAEVDNTPPTLAPRLAFLPGEFGGFRFEPIFAPPELADFTAKFGPVAETDCNDPDGFQRYRRFPFNVPAEQLPARLCVIGLDMADNAGVVHEFVVGD